jgi:hypothetical protein
VKLSGFKARTLNLTSARRRVSNGPPVTLGAAVVFKNFEIVSPPTTSKGGGDNANSRCAACQYGIASHNAARSIRMSETLEGRLRPQIEMGPADCAKT